MSDTLENLANAFGGTAKAAPASGGLLSGLSGLVKGSGSMLGPIAGIVGSLLGGGGGAASTPDHNEVDGRQNLGITFANAFQVGGKGNRLDNNPSTVIEPVDSTKTAATAATGGASLPMNQNALWIVGAVVLGLFALMFFAGRRR